MSRSDDFWPMMKYLKSWNIWLQGPENSYVGDCLLWAISNQLLVPHQQSQVGTIEWLCQSDWVMQPQWCDNGSTHTWSCCGSDCYYGHAREFLSQKSELQVWWPASSFSGYSYKQMYAVWCQEKKSFFKVQQSYCTGNILMLITVPQPWRTFSAYVLCHVVECKLQSNSWYVWCRVEN